MKKKPHPSIASTTARMKVKKRIGLVAHDYRKRDLIDWIDYNRVTLSQHELFGTGTTGGLIQEKVGLDVHRFMSGPLGGDLQLGAAIADRSEEHTSELQSRGHLVCRLLLEKKKKASDKAKQ